MDLLAAWTEASRLRARCREADGPVSMLDVLGQHLASVTVPDHPGFLRIERAVVMLEADPTRQIADVAAELDVSHAHLDRQFTELVGLSPRAMARLLRLRRLLEQLDVRTDPDWASIAAERGWLPDSMIRAGVRARVARKARLENARSAGAEPIADR